MGSDRRGPLLLVDDEPRVLRGLMRMLDSEWEVLEATNGARALELLREHSIAILVSDVVMPGMDGLQLLQSAASVSPHTIRILLTGRGDYAVAVRAVNEARAFGFLQKPCSATELVQTLDDAEAHYAKLVSQRSAELRANRLQQSLEAIARVVEQVGIEADMVPTLDPAHPDLVGLSTREWEVVRLLLKGHRASSIARTLSISAHTVRSHLRRVFQKLDVHSQEELVERIRGAGH